MLSHEAKSKFTITHYIMATILRNMTTCLQPIWREGCAFHVPIHLHTSGIKCYTDFFEIIQVYFQLTKTKLPSENKI